MGICEIESDSSSDDALQSNNGSSPEVQQPKQPKLVIRRSSERQQASSIKAGEILTLGARKKRNHSPPATQQGQDEASPGVATVTDAPSQDRSGSDMNSDDEDDRSYDNTVSGKDATGTRNTKRVKFQEEITIMNSDEDDDNDREIVYLNWTSPQKRAKQREWIQWARQVETDDSSATISHTRNSAKIDSATMSAVNSAQRREGVDRLLQS